MIRIGITGQSGFVGKHLYNTIGLFGEEFERVDFKRAYFTDGDQMDAFVLKCDVIVHLAGLNRHNDPNVIYDTNIQLVESIIASLERTNAKVHVIFSSSSQEEKENLYGKSKREGREKLVEWARNTKNYLTGLVIPNVFGPFGQPYYNSVIATFSHQVSHGETPVIQVDGELQLIYVGELVQLILNKIRRPSNEHLFQVGHTATIKVSKILSLLEMFKATYQERGEIPALTSVFELNLFNTYRCYMDIKGHFPVKFVQHIDPRGSFVEIIRLNGGGQVSFSTTIPSITRGNHFHTRKIERFAVIKGKALIQLRQIGTDEVLNFELSGDEPAYVDMPVWYTHNIKNVGEEVLLTNFWINEFYDPKDPDTYFENV